MPQTGDIYTVSEVLTAVSIGRGANSYLADAIFPALPVKTKLGQILRADAKADALKAADLKRAPGAAVRMVDFDIDHPISYNIPGRALGRLVPDEHRATYNPAEMAAVKATMHVAERMRVTREIEAVAALDAALTGDLTSSPSTKWNDSGGDAIGDILAKMTLMEASELGITPNSLAIDIQVLREIGQSEAFLDRVKHTSVPSVDATAQILANLLGLDNVYVARINRQNTAGEGATPVTARIWGEKCLLFYKEQPAIETIGFGSSVIWTHPELSGPGFDDGIVVEEFRKAENKADGVVMTWHYQDLIVNPGAAHWFYNTLT